jgi:hypothetical protein
MESSQGAVIIKCSDNVIVKLRFFIYQIRDGHDFALRAFDFNIREQTVVDVALCIATLPYHITRLALFP